MEAIAHIQRAPHASFLGDSACFSIHMLSVPQKLAMKLAMVATLASLGVALYTGWQSGGLFIERIIRIVLVGVAVFFMHWLPMGWSVFRGIARFAAFALWIVATMVILYGQVTFFFISQQHAGNLRAASVPIPSASTSTELSPGRSRTEIAKEVTKVSTDLARALAAQCIGDCRTLKVRRARLAAEITALHTEADEAQHREASEERRNAQADRIDELRAMLRADPVASPVASWLGVSEHRLELFIGLAHAVVLEGAAIVAWLMVSVAPGRAAVVSNCGCDKSDRAGSREPIASGREAAAPEREAVAPDRTATAGECAGSLIPPEDDLLLQKIHDAVSTGHLKPTQEAIRKFLRCGQPKAGSLNRQYLARFGIISRQEGDARAPDVVMPALPTRKKDSPCQ